MIAAPLVYDANDQALVDAYESLAHDAQLGAYWGDPAVDSLRSRVKAFYIEAQNTRCCYCNRHLGTDNHRMWDVEHIVCRKKHPRFMFKPKNLAASCPDCNLAKGEQEVLRNTKRKTYPSASADFRIIHAHFDEFSEHIYNNGHIYIGKTEKGKKTIYICDLLRFAQKYIDWENSASETSFEAEVEDVFQADAVKSQVAVDKILSELAAK